MNNSTMKVIISLLAFMMLISVATQIKAAFDGNYKTETALRYTAEDSVEFKGIFVRNESVIASDVSGVVSYMYPDGSKIGKDSVAAEIYDSEEAVKINEEIVELENQIELLKKAQNPGTTEVAQPEFISKQLDLSYNKLSVFIDEGNYDSIKKERDNFQVLSNILQIVIGKEENYDNLISLYQTRLDNLKSRQKKPSLLVKSKESGYFVSYADGYEEQLSKKNIDKLTADQIKGIASDKNADTRKKGIGKIIYGYDWNMIGIVDNSKNKFLEGAKVLIKLQSLKNPISVEIQEIKETENPNESILVLYCDKLTEDLVQHRIENAEIILNKYNGIKVPRNAIRFNASGEKGVYVQMGEQILFKKIDVIYDSEDYIISKETGLRGTLQLYDDIIVEGIPRQDEILTEETDPSETEILEDISIVVGETTSADISAIVSADSVNGSAGGNE